MFFGCPNPAQAQQQNRWYGAGGGVASYLDPAHRPGGWIAFSAGMGEESLTPPLVAVRGTLVGVVAAKDQWAIMPLLTGDIGATAGPLELVVTGGAQLFGAARREQWTVFATFGMVGGAGVSIKFAEDMRLSLRGQLIWIPPFSRAKLDGPDEGEAPNFLLIFGGLYFEVARAFSEF